MAQLTPLQFTPYQEDFIKANYLTMYDSEIVKRLGISTWHLLRYRNENGLLKKNPNKPKVVKMTGKFFNVDAMEWIA